MKRKTNCLHTPVPLYPPSRKSVAEFNAVEIAYHIIGLLDCTPKTGDFNKMIRDLRKWKSIKHYSPKQTTSSKK